MAYPLLKYGSKGEAVVRLQNELNEHGYSLRVDGDFGYKTLMAVKQFQAKFNLDVDGEVGPITWAALLKFPDQNDLSTLGARIAATGKKYALGNYKESDGSYNYFRAKFLSKLGKQNWAWCAAFVHKCLEEASNRDLPISPGTGPATFALVETWQRWAEKYSYKRDPRSYEPVEGDLVLFDWSGATYPDADYENHIGIFLYRDGNAYVCAEGNVENRTMIKRRFKSNIQWFLHLPSDFVV